MAMVSLSFTPVMEEATGTMPLAIIPACSMNVILSTERCLEVRELNVLGFLYHSAWLLRFY